MNAMNTGAPDWTTIWGLRVTQVDSDTIEISNINWFDIAPPDVLFSSIIYESFLSAMDARLREHLAVTSYPAASGDECGDGGMEMEIEERGYGDVNAADSGYGMM